MDTLNKVILSILNILGGIVMGFGLIVPFIVTPEETTALILGLWMIVAGFILFYVSNKFLSEITNNY